ncbi:MAG: CvpA family protein [Bacteroidales bacterium]|nr:CvpA family protein [Bacteroidales bacterium]
MLIVDIVIVLLLIITAFRGFSKGFVMQLAGLIAMAAGILAAYFFWNASYLMIQQWVEWNHHVLKVIAVIGTTLVVTIVILLLGKLLSKVIHLTPFGILDRLLGVIFGIVRMVLLLSFVIFALLYINPEMQFLQDEYLNQSYLLPYIKSVVPMLIDIFFSTQMTQI